MYFIALIIGGLLILYLALSKENSKHDYLQEFNRTVFVDSMDVDQQAVNLKSFSAQRLLPRLLLKFKTVQRQLGKAAPAKILGFAVLLAILAIYINHSFFRDSAMLVMALTQFFGFSLAYFWLQKREWKQFEESFPDALNMLSSAVSAGESLMHAIIFVGKSLDGEVGKEFKRMGERLQLGESPDSVFKKSCIRFPYPSFNFFVITLRANMQRGGQLKEIIARLNRLMFDSRAIDKKKYALTAEARASAKIVGAIPFIFLFMLQFLSPENFEFVMFNPAGRPILYYVLISETIGMLIIWLLMTRVK